MPKYKVEKNRNLIEFIRENNIRIDTTCSGNHTCGKCKLTIKDLVPNDIEKRLLTSEEIDAGIRLACTHVCLDQDICFDVAENEDFDILGSEVRKFSVNIGKSGYAIAVDLGTTTVVIELVNLKMGLIEKECTFLNPQRIYGFDVISRIEETRVHGVKKLQEILVDELFENVKDLIIDKDIKLMAVSGNPTMNHIFMNVCPLSIAQAPYTCKVTELTEIDSTLLFNTNKSFPVVVLPPISAYVGADIVMGIYSSEMYKQEFKSILIDLGTNGEIALFDGIKLYVSSAACGPAFEGGNMSEGKGAISGAINKFTYDGKWNYTTINNHPAIGICGSGYMSLLAFAYKHSFIEDSGYMVNDIQITEDIWLMKKDVREFQMAKSAITAAILCLIEKAKLTDRKSVV